MDHSYGTEELPTISVGDEFSSLEEFQNVLTQFMKETNTVYNVAKSQCINDRHLESMSSDLSKNQMLKRKLKYSYAVFGCKHYGIVRSKGRGMRPNQKTFKTDCPSHISVFTDRQREKLVVKSMVLQHNHHLGPDMAQLYPENRRVRGASRLDRKFGVSTRTLRDALLPDSLPAPNISPLKNSEGHSLSASEDGGGDVDWDECINQLQGEFGCEVKVLREGDELRGMFLQDANMMHTFNSFPELLCVAGNVSVIQGSIRLVFFIVEDSLGKSEVIALGLLTGPRDDAGWLLSTFREQNKTSCYTTIVLNNWSRIHDGILKSVFPDCVMLLSPTQCQREWKKHVPRGASGITEEGEDLAYQLLHRALSTTSEPEYDQVHSEMVSAFPPEVLYYYENQWHQDHHRWCLGLSFGTEFMSSTGALVESIRRRLALRSVTRDSMPAFFGRFFTELYRQRTEYKGSICISKSVLTVMSNIHEALSEHVSVLTPHALTLITEQYNLTGNCKPFDYIDKTGNHRDSVNVPVTSCSCPFFVSVGLPCCHLIKRRDFLGLETFDLSLCSTRWTKDHYLTMSSHRQVVKEASKPLTLFQKLSQATELTSELATLLSKCSDKVFFQRMEVLKQLLHHWQNNHNVLLASVIDEGNDVDMATETADERQDISDR